MSIAAPETEQFTREELSKLKKLKKKFNSPKEKFSSTKVIITTEVLKRLLKTEAKQLPKTQKRGFANKMRGLLGFVVFMTATPVFGPVRGISADLQLGNFSAGVNAITTQDSGHFLITDDQTEASISRQINAGSMQLAGNINTNQDPKIKAIFQVQTTLGTLVFDPNITNNQTNQAWGYNMGFLAKAPIIDKGIQVATSVSNEGNSQSILPSPLQPLGVTKATQGNLAFLEATAFVQAGNTKDPRIVQASTTFVTPFGSLDISPRFVAN